LIALPDSTHDIETLVRSRVPIILIETPEERRAVDLFRTLAIRLGQPGKKVKTDEARLARSTPENL